MSRRVALALTPTPLHPAPALSRAIGTEVWIKRDDLTGAAGGGNKLRKMELLAADARRADADILVSVGALQSNHARTVAATAAVLGMECHLVLGGDRPARPSGNVALAALFGAHLSFTGTDDWDALDDATRTLTSQLEADGRRPYAIPVGGSVPLGAAAFAAAYLEARDQWQQQGVEPAVILHASSSGGTQAGLELGRHLAGDTGRIVGVDVAKITASLVDHVQWLVRETAALLDVAPPATPPLVLDGYVGAGYAVRSKGSEAALRLLARSEGILADPVYTAKALHALCEERFDGPVLFWHTGGVPALHADDVGLRHWHDEATTETAP